ncbi:TetR/AcrR family transcriptional regulator [Novosphingobium colocasiae]|uniref:TetR/AcrR family transcriptional regulator n=1 Tax=Novosphingobium colocasiae TaxID=1256513 RepID=UPI0035B3FE7C
MNRSNITETTQDGGADAHPRGRRADGAATRQRILEAAGELIGEQGFAQVTGRAIAARAEVDVASINYHFGSREQLYRMLLVEAHTRLVTVEELEAIVNAPAPPEARLRRLIDMAVARAMGEDWWIVHVLAREIMGPTSHFAVLRPLIAQKFGIAVKLFAELTGYRQGDPQLVLNAIASAAPFGAMLVLRRSFGQELSPWAQLSPAAVVDHLAAYVLAGLRAVSRPG